MEYVAPSLSALIVLGIVAFFIVRARKPAAAAGAAPASKWIVAREEDYEVYLPAHWAKRQEPDGSWILHSTRGPETLRIRVLIPAGGAQIADVEAAAKAAALGLSQEMSEHAVVASSCEGDYASVTGTGASLQHKALLAYRVVGNRAKIVWALHEVGFPDAPALSSLRADASMDQHRLELLASLQLRP